MRRLLAPLLALLAGACVAVVGAEQSGEADAEHKRFPMSWDYPAGTMQRIAFAAPNPEHWRISALTSPDRPDAPWKIVIVTGTPSWSEYWAPTIAALAPDREIVVADRPGFAQSQPDYAVTDIAAQAEALAPALAARPGQRVLVVGQSFGAPISILMARAHPGEVDALLLLSPYFGERGPTANRMYQVGRLFGWALGRDLKHAIAEVGAQRDQLPPVWAALSELSQPVLFVQGDRDSFITLASTEAVAARYGAPVSVIPGGDHFINACCVAPLLAAFETAIAQAEAAPAAPGAAAPALP